MRYLVNGSLVTLLRLGGRIVVSETVKAAAWLDLVPGLTTGWCRYADRHRQAHPLLNTAYLAQ